MRCTTSGGCRCALVALAVFSIVSVCSFNVANAVLIAYEPFNYPVGDAVNGKDGGHGFTGPWGQQGATAIPANSNVIDAGSLTGPVGLPTVGNHAFLTGEFNTLQMARPFANVAGTDGTTTWYSFLAQRLGATTTNVPGNDYPRGANVGLFDTEAVSEGGTANERVGVGNSSNATTDAWSIIPKGSGPLREPTNDPWSTLSWGVLRIDHVGTATDADSAWLWINPDPLGGEPLKANAGATLLNTDPDARDYSDIDFLRPFVGNNAGTVGNTNFRPFAQLVVDEIRLGTTWDDMRDTAGIPEPASCVLLVLGGVAWCFRRVKS